jgi:hypothetical protein
MLGLAGRRLDDVYCVGLFVADDHERIIMVCSSRAGISRMVAIL